MDEIRSIGARTWAIASDFLLKYRSATPPADFTIWVSEFQFLVPVARARVQYRLPRATVAAFCAPGRVSFSLTPLPPFSWLTLSLDPSDSGLNPALVVQKSCALSAHLDASGRVSFTRQGRLPAVGLSLDYRDPYFRLRLCPRFPGGEMRYAVEGSAVLSLAYQSLRADLVFERADGEVTEGARGRFRNCEVGVLSSSERGELFFAGRWRPWTLGFHYAQTFPSPLAPGRRAESSAACGIRYTAGKGYAAASLRLPGGVCAKAKLAMRGGWSGAVVLRAAVWDLAPLALAVSLRRGGAGQPPTTDERRS
jgi:hypothetical protein